MLKLEETNHSYYCEVYETQGTDEYDSWEDFKTVQKRFGFMQYLVQKT